jgi:hypothetical protein
MVPWTFERSGPLANVAADGGYYYAQIAQGIHSDGQMFEVLDVFPRQVGIKPFFQIGRLRLLIMLIALGWTMGISLRIDR